MFRFPRPLTISHARPYGSALDLTPANDYLECDIPRFNGPRLIPEGTACLAAFPACSCFLA